MPGSPATSPRFGAPRYADTDTASFSAQVNGVTDAFDSGVEKRWVPNLLTGNATASDHQIVVAGPSETVTLPTPSSENELVCVYAKESVAGTTPVTINYGGAGGGKIFGRGLATAGVTSLNLGYPGSFVWLFSYDGTNWRIVNGEFDTGWLAFSYGPGVSASTLDVATPGVRVRADRAYLRGALTDASGTTLWANMPSVAIPTFDSYMTQSGLYVQGSGNLSPGQLTTGASATIVYLDNLSYSMSLA